MKSTRSSSVPPCTIIWPLLDNQRKSQNARVSANQQILVHGPSWETIMVHERAGHIMTSCIISSTTLTRNLETTGTAEFPKLCSKQGMTPWMTTAVTDRFLVTTQFLVMPFSLLPHNIQRHGLQFFTSFSHCNGYQQIVTQTNLCENRLYLTKAVLTKK